MEKNNKCDCQCIHNEKLNVALDYLKNIKTINQLADFYKSFSDHTRIKILAILDKVGQMCVNDISVALSMTKSAISHQLRYLKDCNLVKCTRLGKIVFYSLADDHVKTIIEKGIEHLEEEK